MTKILAAICLFFLSVIMFGTLSSGCEYCIRKDMPTEHYIKAFYEGGLATTGMLIGFALFIFAFLKSIEVLTKK